MFQEHVLRMAFLSGGHSPSHSDQNWRLRKLQSSGRWSSQDCTTAERPAAEEGTQKKKKTYVGGHDNSQKLKTQCKLH